jgi:WD40 repeat protein
VQSLQFDTALVASNPTLQGFLDDTSSYTETVRGTTIAPDDIAWINDESVLHPSQVLASPASDHAAGVQTRAPVEVDFAPKSWAPLVEHSFNYAISSTTLSGTNFAQPTTKFDQVSRTLNRHLDDVAFFAFSADSRTLASASQSGPFITLWDVKSGAQLGELQCCRRSPGAAVFLPDGTTLGVASINAKS